MLSLIVVIERKYSESPAREVDIMAMIMIMSLTYLSSYILLLRNCSFLQLKSWLQNILSRESGGSVDDAY